MSTDPQKTIQEIIDLYLGEEHPDEHTQEQFRAWLAGDGHRKEKYEALEKAFEREVRFDPAPSRKVLDSYREMTGAARGAGVERSRSRKRTALRIAAAAVPALIAAATILYLLNQRLSEHFDVTVLSDVTESTERGTQKHIILPDGSQAWINSGSSIGYCDDFGSKRTVYLDGEAYFIVKASVQQPFTVKTENMTAVATEAQFNVKAYCDSAACEIVVAEGSLDAFCGGQTYRLADNTHIRMDNRSQRVTVHRIVDGELPQWMSQLRFEDTPLEHVLYIISGFFGVKIDLAAELELEGNFTAAFEEGPTLDNVLRTLQNTVPDFNYRIDGNTVRITEKQVRDEKISK